MSEETRIENCEFARLKAAIKEINEAALEGIEKMRVVGVKKTVMVENLTKAVEDIAEEHGEEAIPEKSLLLFNDIHMEGESPLDHAPEKPVRKAVKTKAKEDKPKKAKREKVEKDKYGTRPNTLARAFITAIKKTPMKMADVRKESWNPKGYHFNDTVERLCEINLASVDNDGVISIIG